LVLLTTVFLAPIAAVLPARQSTEAVSGHDDRADDDEKE
jgi:hypothetical protein